MQRFVSRALFIAVIAGVTVVGLVDAGRADTTTPTGGGSSLVHVTVPSAGISLGYPANWTATKYSGLPKAARKKIAKLNPKLADEAQSAPPDAKLYVVDRTQPGSFASNINVIVVTSGGFPASLGDFRQFVESEYQALGANLQSASAVEIGGKKSYNAVAVLPVRVDATTTVNAYIDQVLIPKGDGGAVVTITTSDDEPGHALAQQVASTIRVAH